MSYFTCLEDVAEDVEVMIFRFIGNEHPRDKHDDIESYRNVDDAVALYVTNLCKAYDPAHDANVLDRMTYYLSPSLGDDEEDSPPHALGLMLKLARTKFIADLNMMPLSFEQVFKWFMGNAQRMKDDGIATTEVMEKAYRAYWVEQYDAIMKEIKRFAIELDNRDDVSYAMDARNDFEDSGGW
jgi:hypothetical protein